MLLVSSCSCLHPIRWSQVLSWEWRCSWSSADRRCSNFIWVINNSIAYKSAAYIRDLTVYSHTQMSHTAWLLSMMTPLIIVESIVIFNVKGSCPATLSLYVGSNTEYLNCCRLLTERLCGHCAHDSFIKPEFQFFFWLTEAHSHSYGSQSDNDFLQEKLHSFPWIKHIQTLDIFIFTILIPIPWYLHSGIVITRSNITRYYIQHCNDSGRT